MANLVLICDAKSWFSFTEQSAMAAGNAGPVLRKALEIQNYAYAVRWTAPIPASTSTLAQAMDSDLQAVAAIVKDLSATLVSVGTMGQSIQKLEVLCKSIVTNDGTWSTTSDRPPVVARLAAKTACSFWQPFACVESVGGVALKWAAILGVVYFGGKWLLARTAVRKLVE